MSKKQSLNEKARVYFESFDEQKSTFRCKIENCGKVISGKNSSAFVSHIKHVHTELFQDKIAVDSINPTVIAVKRLELIQQLTEIVTVNGRPFNYLADSGFQDVIREKVDFLRANNSSIELKCPYSDIKKYIFETEIKMREHIKAETGDRVVAMMIDIGSRNSWSFLSMSLQYVIDGYIKVRNIGIIRMEKRHKAQYIEERIVEQLGKFGIDKLAVFVFTTDNASNMIAAVKLFDDDIGNEMEEFEDQETDHPTQSICSTHQSSSNIQNDSNICGIRNVLQQYDCVADNDTHCQADPELAIILDDEAAFQESIESVANNFRRSTINVDSVPCSAHTLQLAVRDALENANEVSEIISLCRLAAKLLRRETYIYDLNAANIYIKKVRIDCEVRWNSIYFMVCNDHLSCGCYENIFSCH